MLDERGGGKQREGGGERDACIAIHHHHDYYNYYSPHAISRVSSEQRLDSTVNTSQNAASLSINITEKGERGKEKHGQPSLCYGKVRNAHLMP